MAEALLGIGLLVFLSLFFSAAFKRTLIPDVLLLILMEIVLGPAVLGWVKPEDLGKIGGVMSTVALVEILFEGGTALDVDLLKKMLRTTVSLAGLIGIAAGLGWAAVLNTMRQFPNTSFAVFAYMFVIYGVADMLGFSGAIAALAFGAALTNYNHLPLHRVRLFREREMGALTHRDMEFYHEVIFLLKTFFFVYLGLSIRFANAVYLVYVLGAVVVVYVGRTLIVRWVMKGVSPGWEESYQLSVMAPKGLAAAVLASIPAERGMEGGRRDPGRSLFHRAGEHRHDGALDSPAEAAGHGGVGWALLRPAGIVRLGLAGAED